MVNEIENARNRLKVTVAFLCEKAGVDAMRYYKARRRGGHLSDDDIEALTSALKQIDEERQALVKTLRSIGLAENAA